MGVVMVFLIARLLSSLAVYGRPRQVAFGIATGAALALVPSTNLIWWVLFAIIFFIKLNQAALIGTLGLCRLWVTSLDPTMERWGYGLLTAPPLSEPLSTFLSWPIAGWTRLDDSLVAGSLATAMVSWIPLFLAGLLLVRLWRRYLSAPVARVFRNWGKKVPFFGKLFAAVSRSRALFRLGGAG